MESCSKPAPELFNIWDNSHTLSTGRPLDTTAGATHDPWPYCSKHHWVIVVMAFAVRRAVTQMG